MLRQLCAAAKTSIGLAFLLTSMSSLALAQTAPATPEIDAGSVANALALLFGGVALLGDKFCAKRRN
jgi:hypothetical protein